MIQRARGEQPGTREVASGLHRRPTSSFPAVVARPDEIQRIVQLAADGTSVEITGVRWSGRSQLLGYVHAALVDRGVDVLPVSGLGALLPLEAVAAVLPPVYREVTSGDERSVVAVRDALVEFLAEGQSVVLVDDADRLDAMSWGVLVSACNLVGRPIVSSRHRRAAAEGTNSLVAVARSVVQVSLEELRLEVLHAILEERLGGTLSPAVSARIHTEAAGNPGLAIVLLDGAVSEGLLRRVGDQWTAGASLWSTDAGDAYGSILSFYSAQVRDAVELLAVVGTVDLRTAWALLGEEVVEDLERYRLVRLTPVGTDRRPMVSVYPPGLAEYHRHETPTARRYRIVARAADRIQEVGEGIDPHDKARLLSSLRLGTPTSGSALDPRGPGIGVDVPVVARLFAETYTLELAAARDRWEREQSVKSAVHYLQTQLLGRNDPEEFERVLAGTELGEISPTDDVRFRHVRSRWLLSQGASVDEVVTALLDDVDSGAPHRDILDTLACAVRWEHEALDPDYAQVLGPRVDRGGFGGRLAGLVLASCHMIAGRPEDSLRVLALLEDGPLGAEQTGAELLRGLALYATGRFAELFEIATDRVQQAITRLDRLEFAGYSYLAALAHMALGRLDVAQDALSVVLSSGIGSTFMTFSPDRAILVAMSVISTRTGHPVAAASFLEHAQQVPGATDSLPFGSAAWAEAVALAAGGDHDGAAATFASLLDGLRSRGYTFAADVATMLSLTSAYDPDRALEFRDRAAALGGGLYTAALDARAAGLAGDARAVEDAARALQERGAGNDALTFYALAARLYRDQGIPERGAAVQAAARALADTLGISERAMAALEEPDFTAREREVIRLVAAGRSNSEIAAELFVGVRTVESHLRNIRRKSGAVGRRDIAAYA